MLWRKHWREVRWMALFGVVALAALGWYALGDLGKMERQYVYPSADGVRPATYQMRPISFWSASRGYLIASLPLTLITVAILLGIGGLGYERSAGTSVFTLSLPFSRRRIIMNRFLVGAATVLGLTMAAVMCTSAWAAIRGTGDEFPPLRALGLGSCFAAVALTIYAFAFLAANVTAHAVRSIATVVMLSIVSSIVLESPRWAPDPGTLAWFLGPLDFIKLVSRNDVVRTGTMPWAGIVIGLMLTAGLLVATVRWVERYDF
jgi:ABC-type transport system involved in multi-copper enzyme maturation permease subunit